MTKRIFDVFFGSLAVMVLSLPLLLLYFLVKLTSKGPAIHWSDRIGRNNIIFKMAKFRTMRIDTPQVATHLLANPRRYLTPLGKLLRKFSLDELPQLYNIIKGDLSFVGPRPALFNQSDLMELRTQKGIYRLTPGLTGWAQINGRDEIPIPEKVGYDEYYLEHQSIFFDIKIIFITLIQVLRGKGVSH